MSSEAEAGSVGIKVLRTAKGQTIKAGDEVAVWYTGTLVDGGSQFDSNYNFPAFEQVAGRTPFTFVVGAGQVIAGWDQGLVGLPLGQMVELTIPGDLAYGATGSPPAIPPDAALRFQVELIGVLPKDEDTPVYPTFEDLGLSKKVSRLASQLSQTAQATKIGTDAGDQLVGGARPDLLIGLLGDDQITGAEAADVLIGGVGANRFIYNALSDSPAKKGATDSLVGFNAKAGDRIDLSNLEGSRRFMGRKGFRGTAGEVRFQAGILQLDADGDKRADLAVLLPGVNRLPAAALLL